MQKFTPLEYLKIDIANNYGLDKENWDTRLQWFDDHEHEIRSLATLIEGGILPKDLRKHPLMAEADQPAMFYAGIRAWLKATRGEAISYAVSLPLWRSRSRARHKMSRRGYRPEALP